MRSALRKLIADRGVRCLLGALLLARWLPRRGRPKILYALTPPPRLRNVGDHAQVVAIRRWVDTTFPGHLVLEVNKDEVASRLAALGWILTPTDLIFIHSGGNLGDRGLWSESGRRLLISSFPRNRIVSLPQTIFFSDTPTGREQREVSRRVYGQHPALTVIGRDPVSATIARELFPRAQTFAAPDFVLSLPPRNNGRGDGPIKILFCLRNDGESTLTHEDRARLIRSVPHASSVLDTTIGRDIRPHERELLLEDMLCRFEAHDAVVTDRFHGTIFAVLCRRPAVVLPTVDHKLTSALQWFAEVPFVKPAATIVDVPRILEEVLAVDSRAVPDWNALYFESLGARLGLVNERGRGASSASAGAGRRVLAPRGDTRRAVGTPTNSAPGDRFE